MKRIKRGKLIGEVVEVARHRNGMCGAPFHVVLFTMFDKEEKRHRNMVGIVYEAAGHVSVFDRDDLGRGVIAFGGTTDGMNSWRGDVFERELREAIAKSETQTWGAAS